MFNPWVLLVFVLALGAATGGAYWQGRQDGKDGCIAESVRDEAVAAIASEAAASAAAGAINKLGVKHVTIRQQADTIIREVPVYRDCRHDHRVLRDINEARTGQRSEPAGDDRVPGVAAPAR